MGVGLVHHETGSLGGVGGGGGVSDIGVEGGGAQNASPRGRHTGGRVNIWSKKYKKKSLLNIQVSSRKNSHFTAYDEGVPMFFLSIHIIRASFV